MTEIAVDKNLIGCCGLYCAACGRYLKGKCKGCKDNIKATWCKVRKCCNDLKYSSCASCTTIQDFKKCNKLNNFISKIFSLIFRSNRIGSLCYIREKGNEAYAKEMAEKKCQSLKK